MYRSIFTRATKYLAVIAVGCVGLPGQAQLLDDAEWFTRSLGAGVTWKYYHFDNLFGAKQSITVVEVDASNPQVNFHIGYRDSFVGPSPGLNSPLYPRAFTSTMAGEVTNSRAAINGGYFNTASYNADNPTAPWGGGVGYLRVGGSTIHNVDGSNVNNHGMGILFNNRSDFTISRKGAGWHSLRSFYDNMMVCGPVLVSNGVIETYAPDNNHANFRHPRSAVGKKNSGNRIFLVTVDGRHSEAAGMSCTELAQVMKALGCDNAINLDGGGSTTMWGRGEPHSGVLNFPSDNGQFDHLGQRRAANALIVSSAPPVTASYDARLQSVEYSPLTRTGDVVTATVRYTNIGTQPWTAASVKIVPSRQFGRTSAFIPAESANTFATMSPSVVNPGATATFQLSLTAPAVATNTNFNEHFALWNTGSGYFGPPDGDVKVKLTVRPPIAGAPPVMIVQGGSEGLNNQWLVEGPSGWSNSSVSFTAPGVANPGTQRYASADVTGRYADFRPIFDVRGIYRVEAAWPYSSNNVNSVRYTINHMFGSSQITMNQNNSDLANAWQLLGDYSFGTESTGNFGVHSVRVSNLVTGNRFYSGALRFDYVSPLTEVGDWSIY